MGEQQPSREGLFVAGLGLCLVMGLVGIGFAASYEPEPDVQPHAASGVRGITEEIQEGVDRIIDPPPPPPSRMRPLPPEKSDPVEDAIEKAELKTQLECPPPARSATARVQLVLTAEGRVETARVSGVAPPLARCIEAIMGGLAVGTLDDDEVLERTVLIPLRPRARHPTAKPEAPDDASSAP